MKIDIQTINMDNINILQGQGYNVLYGAGRTGDFVCQKFISANIKIDFIVDDDMNKWNTRNSFGFVIKSLDELEEDIKEKSTVNIIITSIYGNLLINRLKKLYEINSNINIFEAIDLRKEDFKLIKQIQLDYKKNKKDWNLELERAIDIVEDEESKKVLKGIRDYFETGDRTIVHKICSNQDFYFIKEVKNSLTPRFNIIDGGAYIGDLYRQLEELEIPFGNWYCFECDIKNYNLLEKNFENKLIRNQMIIENRGLSDKTRECYVESDGVCSKLVDYKTAYPISVVSIDDYFDNKKIDYIKMDIEGEELSALQGGIETIKRCRPIMAISIYHKLYDYVSILSYLKSILTNYRFMVRHHAWVLGKTILYCIPKEKEDMI